MRRAAALGCLAAVLAADWVILRRKPRWIVSGLFDEPAHVATAGLVLLGAPRRSGRWTRGFLVGAALPDLDHVPLALSRVHPDIDDPRPVTHCLLAIAPLALAGVVTRGAPSEYATGAVAGALVHFARDLAVGTGVALFRPLDGRSLKVPYPLYATAVVALAAGAARRRTASRADQGRPAVDCDPAPPRPTGATRPSGCQRIASGCRRRPRDSSISGTLSTGL